MSGGGTGRRRCRAVGPDRAGQWSPPVRQAREQYDRGAAERPSPGGTAPGAARRRCLAPGPHLARPSMPEAVPKRLTTAGPALPAADGARPAGPRRAGTGRGGGRVPRVPARCVHRRATRPRTDDADVSAAHGQTRSTRRSRAGRAVARGSVIGPAPGTYGRTASTSGRRPPTTGGRRCRAPGQGAPPLPVTRRTAPWGRCEAGAVPGQTVLSPVSGRTRARRTASCQAATRARLSAGSRSGR